MQVPFMFTCVRAVHAPCFLSPFSFRFSSKVTLPLPPPSQPPFAATVPAAVRRMQEYLSPALQARKPPRSTLSASRVCSSAPPRPRNPKTPRSLQKSVPVCSAFLRRSRRAASALRSASAVPVRQRSTQKPPLHSPTRAYVRGGFLMPFFFLLYLISGSKLGFSSFSVGASTTLGSSALATGISSLVSSFFLDFLPPFCAAASIDSVD